MTDPLDESELLKEIASLRAARAGRIIGDSYVPGLPVGSVEATLLHVLAIVRVAKSRSVFYEAP